MKYLLSVYKYGTPPCGIMKVMLTFKSSDGMMCMAECLSGSESSLGLLLGSWLTLIERVNAYSTQASRLSCVLLMSGMIKDMNILYLLFSLA